MSHEVVTVYFDYVCPYAWRAAEVTELVAAELPLSFEWRHFSLYQSNYQGTDGWQLWNERLGAEDEGGTKGLAPFIASCAARRQGKALHDRFRLGVMRARHRDHRPLNLSTLRDVAGRAGLDLARFESDLSDPECRTVLAHEHCRAAASNIFGTPTFAFPSGHTAYLRLREVPSSAAEAAELFSSYRQMLERYPYLETLKRPRPKGN